MIVTVLVIYFVTVLLTNCIYLFFARKEDLRDNYSLWFQQTLIPLVNMVILGIQLLTIYNDLRKNE